jgi:predicted  nucleic acid-binding Zn-ribbon protein
MQFLNYYHCPRCDKDWTDQWSATCDDDCPHCGCRHISPYRSEDAEDGGDAEGAENDEPLSTSGSEPVRAAPDKFQISVVTKDLKLLADFGPDVVVIRIDFT